MAKEIEIYAIGHSTHPLDKFVELLQAHEIETLVDVRTVPRSRSNPQFNQDHLKHELPRAGIRYIHLITYPAGRGDGAAGVGKV